MKGLKKWVNAYGQPDSKYPFFLRIPLVSTLDDHNLFNIFFQTGAAFVYRQRSNFNSPSINHTVERPRHQRIGDNDDDHDDHNQCICEKGGRHHHAAPPNSLWNIKFQIKIKTKQRQGNNKKSHSIRWDQYQNLYWWTPLLLHYSAGHGSQKSIKPGFWTKNYACKD